MTEEKNDPAIPALPEPPTFLTTHLCAAMQEWCGADAGDAAEEVFAEVVRRFNIELRSYAHAAILADRAAGRAAAEPEGWPTEAMVEAGKDERMECFKDTALSVGAALTRIFRAMLVAAPTASIAPKAEAYIDGDCIASRVATPYAAPKAEGEAVKPAKRTPLPKGARIEYQGVDAVVVDDDGGDTLIVDSDGIQNQVWSWELEGHECTVVSLPSAPVAQAAAGASKLRTLAIQLNEAAFAAGRVDSDNGAGKAHTAKLLSLRQERMQKLLDAIAALSPRPEADADRASGGGAECPDCRGSEWRGWKRGVPCYTCKGSGFTPTTKD